MLCDDCFFPIYFGIVICPPAFQSSLFWLNPVSKMLKLQQRWKGALGCMQPAFHDFVNSFH